MSTAVLTSNGQRRSLALLVAISSMVLFGCDKHNAFVAPPPAKVTVAPPTRKPVTIYLEATGNTAPVNSTNLVGRVPGFIQDITYQDGASVKAGTPLFTIEPKPYHLAVQNAEAAQAGANASLAQADANYKRQSELASRDFASQATLDSAVASRASALATLQQAQVTIAQAQLNLSYTSVKAPFDGVVTARQVSLGSYVGSGGPTVLATIVQLDPIYVNFNVGENDVLRIRAGIQRRGLTAAELRQVPVEVGLQNEDGYPHRGTLDYIAPSLTADTGTLAVRAVFGNPETVMLPGYFARVRVPLAQQDNALLVPDVAIGSDQGGPYLLVVGKDNIVEQRRVNTGQLVETERVITSGLLPEDRVVVAGLQRAIPGEKIDPQAPAPNEAARSVP